MQKIIIYTTGNLCTRCNALKIAFQKAGIAYEELNLDRRVVMDCFTDTDIMVQSAPLVRDGAVWKFQDDFFDASGNLLPGWLANMKGIKPHKAGFAGRAETETKKQSCSKIWKGDKI
jgi:hypothetical protein